MKLIINADDFGYSRGHNYGILDCMLDGSVTSTTLLMTTPGTEHAFKLIKKNPFLDVGIHLSLDLGKPLSDRSDIPSLIDQKGKFNTYDLSKNMLNVNSDQVYLEWKKQINYAIDNGVSPTHFDSHHHIHMKEDVFDVFVQLAKEYNAAIRFHPRGFDKDKLKKYKSKIKGIPSADYFTNQFYDNGVDYDFFNQVAERKYEVIEAMCHPAYLDHEILENSSYTYKRVLEQKILKSEKTDALIENLGIELISFKDIL